ncbi:hypothetical protein CAC42_6846 [Sphaceloma murrayae]|uniref:Aminotransferase class I/classII large domain-containing protein n=1 Tax=Sphaceloma murrayae TaxID=2082308 RepID=A0A2K1QHJ4_9PEZI|nr:hypothetical protein CAC42_6846 [Sphaceloma murrayae]
MTCSKIDLATAENWLSRHLLVRAFKQAILNDFTPEDLSYPPDANGNVKLLEALTHFFNFYFCPTIPVRSEHIAAGPGATFVLQNLLTQICAPGEAILVPAPYWSGFDFWLTRQSNITIIPVWSKELGKAPTAELVASLEEAADKADKPVKALLITNPDNPIAHCYAPEVLCALVHFCRRRGLHYVSDEAYALTTFPSETSSLDIPFTSVMSLPRYVIDSHLPYIHVIWSASKAFGSSGARLHNQPLKTAVATASAINVSSFTSTAFSSLLQAKELEAIVGQNQTLIRTNCQVLTDYLKDRSIPFIQVHAGLFVLARLGAVVPRLKEEDLLNLLNSHGVTVGGGHAFHVNESEHGWVRITFSTELPVLVEGIRRIDRALFEIQRE